MKRHISAFILVSSLGAYSLPAQSTGSALFDSRKSQQELEVMRGIISTTLEFAAREAQEDEAKSSSSGPDDRMKFKIKRSMWGGHDVDAYYLYGQGATFIVPLSGVRFGMLAGLEGQLDHYAEFEAQAAVMAAEAALASGARVAVAPAPPAPPVAATPAAPPPPPPPPPGAAPTPSPARDRSAGRVEARKRLAEAQEQVKRRRETSQERQKQLLEIVQQAKAYLIEAVANHGDSLTFLKPNEYINVVISSDGGKFLEDSDGQGRQIISVQKSTIADYKAGRLSLDAFKQKVLQYTN